MKLLTFVVTGFLALILPFNATKDCNICCGIAKADSRT